jgi:hypothetical protein
MANIMVQWMVTGLLSVLHPFFVSVIDISHNAKESTAEISVRIFTDDFEKTLQHFSGSKIDLTHPADRAFVEKQLAAYISQKLKLKINNQPVILHYLGYEIQRESVWSYFEVRKIAPFKKVEVNCNLLYDFESGQMNIFHVKSNKIEKSYKLDNPVTMISFDF